MLPRQIYSYNKLVELIGFKQLYFFSMDAQIIYALALFSFVLFVFVRLKKTESTPNLPPGPKKLPIIGNLLNLGSLPHIQLRDLAQKYGPLMHLKLGEVSTVVVSSAEVAREVMKTHDIIFASRPKILATEILCYDTTDVAFAPYGDYWRQLRKICVLELLSTKRVQSFSPVREEETTNLIKWIASKEGSVLNLSEAVLSSIYTITSRAAFGKRFKGHEEFIAVIKESQKAVSGLNIADLYPSTKWLEFLSGLRIKLEKLHKTSDRIMENIINEHKEANSKGDEARLDKQEDLVDVLLKFQDGNDLGFCLTNDNIKAIIVDVFAAGGDTSATAIEWTMSELIKNPRVMAKAQAEVREVFSGRGTVDETVIDELKYLKSVIREILRLRPPAPLLLPRESRQACEINGFHIPDKCRVIVNAWAIGRDANYWTEPERFYPERFLDSSVDFKGANFEFIPFGAGRRMCPGIAFGLRNVELPLALLLYHFDWKLPNGMRNEDLDMSETFGSTTRRKNDLCLIPDSGCLSSYPAFINYIGRQHKI